MLHVVQVVVWGVAEKPRLFLDEAEARAAYVECAQKQWAQRYAAYCEHHGVSADSFETAQAFLKTIDVSEKSTINDWIFNPEEAGLEGTKNPLHGPGKEEFRHVAKDIGVVKEGLTRLLEDVSQLADRCARMDVSPVAQAVTGPETTVPPPSPAREERPEAAPETYTTPEWKNFVGMIKRLCSGSRNECYLLTRDDWRQDVYSNRTALEYWDWVADRIVRYKEDAQHAGYAVVEEPGSNGYYKFADREGSASEDCYDSEWEAWCAAGLHLQAH